MLRFVFCVLFVALVGAACSDDDQPPAATATPTQIPDTFDPNLMNAIVLQPAEVDAAFVESHFGSDTSRPSYTVSFEDGPYKVSVLITRVPDALTRDQDIFDLRTTFTGIIGFEKTLTLDGAVQAFSYLSDAFNAPRETLLVSAAEGFVFYIDVFATEQSEQERVHRAGRLEEYGATMLRRIQEATSEPPLLQPVEGAPTFAPATPSSDATASSTTD